MGFGLLFFGFFLMFHSWSQHTLGRFDSQIEVVFIFIQRQTPNSKLAKALEGQTEGSTKRDDANVRH